MSKFNTETKKYRKKPVIIEQYQTDKEFDIKTLEGIMHASNSRCNYDIISLNFFT